MKKGGKAKQRLKNKLHNLFVNGPAGAGRTVLLRLAAAYCWRENIKFYVGSFTNLASSNAKTGRTIHKIFGITKVTDKFTLLFNILIIMLMCDTRHDIRNALETIIISDSVFRKCRNIQYSM